MHHLYYLIMTLIEKSVGSCKVILLCLFFNLDIAFQNLSGLRSLLYFFRSCRFGNHFVPLLRVHASNLQFSFVDLQQFWNFCCNGLWKKSIWCDTHLLFVSGHFRYVTPTILLINLSCENYVKIYWCLRTTVMTLMNFS